MELEAYGRMLRLNGYFKMMKKSLAKRSLSQNPLLNLMNMGAPQNIYNNVTMEEQTARYNLKDYQNMVIKCFDKGSVVVVWDRHDYIKQSEK